MTRNAEENWSVGIVVPARNEHRRIGRCLRSLLKTLALAQVNRSIIVVVADRCHDDTASIARAILGDDGRVREGSFASAGAARRVGVEVVMQELADVPPLRLWIANTDADSYVPPDWITQQLTLAERGVSAVAGIVRVDSFRSHGRNGPRLFARHYPLNADGTHPHVHGANIGMRADAYIDAGGWRDLSAGEDHCLWKRVQDRGWPVQSSTQSIVTTSGRLRGRARGGFADTLRTRLRAEPIEMTT